MKYCDSNRAASLSRNKEIHMAGEAHDATDFRYFKSCFTEERDGAEPNWRSNATDCSPAFHENNLKPYFDMDVTQLPSKVQPTSRFQNSERRAMRSGLSRDPKGVKNDVNQYLCAHATKALKVPSSTAKDRHSKVITLKGHRDRRVRLAVSTAIQLYNLQDRLGLDQPSKALDWLMSKAKSSIDELHRPSSISNWKCSSCNTIRNGGPTVLDMLSTTSRADGISPSVPKNLASANTQNKMGSREAFPEPKRVEDLNVAATNVVFPSMLQSRVEASAPVVIFSDRTRSSLLPKKVNTQGELAVSTPSREQSGCLDIGFSNFQSQVGSQAITHDSWTSPLPYSEPADPQIILDGNRLPFAIYSSHVDSGKRNETLRTSALMNSYINTCVPQLTSNTFCERITSSSTMDSSEGIEVHANGGGNGLFYFERGPQ